LNASLTICEQLIRKTTKQNRKAHHSIVVTNFKVFQVFQEARVEIGLTNFACHKEIRKNNNSNGEFI
jgi:hypothetical protein